jgi:aspartyl/asparaginyl beta-hydroxylase (cupin superfamily)
MAAATILKSAMCRTKVKPRPAPTLFFFPGLSSSCRTYDDIQFSNSSFLKPEAQQLDDIRTEYLHLRNLIKTDYTLQKDEHQLHKGKWDWNSFILKGKIQREFIESCPKTVSFLENIRHFYGVPTSKGGIGSIRLMTDTPFSFAFFSTLHSQSTIAPHYGPCNLRLRCHLPIIVPSDVEKIENNTSNSNNNSSSSSNSDFGVDDNDGVACGMRVGDEVVQWRTGQPLLFDDCYEHSVWNNTSSERVLLLFDVWHPDLHNDEIEAIVDMFRDAQEKGWLS